MSLRDREVDSEAMRVAKRIVQHSDFSINNLRLQRYLYIASVVYMGRHGTRLFDDRMSRGLAGPYVNNVYRQLQMFGARPISWFYRITSDMPPGPRRDFVDEMSDALADVSDGKLVSVTRHLNTTVYDEDLKSDYGRFFVADELNQRDARTSDESSVTP